MKQKRLKNIFLVEKFSKEWPETSSFYYTGEKIKDITGKEFDILQRGKAEFYVDLPVGQNDLGIEHKGFFVLIGKAHPFTRDFRDLIEKRKHMMLKINFCEGSDKLITKFNNYYNEKEGRND